MNAKRQMSWARSVRSSNTRTGRWVSVGVTAATLSYALHTTGCVGPRMARSGRPSAAFAESGQSAPAIAFDDTAGYIFIDARINGGQKRHRFLVDTGAGTSALSPALVEGLGLRPAGWVKAIGAEGQSQAVPTVRLDQLEIAGVTFEEVGAIVVSLSALERSACLEVAGVIGMNLLRHGLLEIDYAARVLRYAPSSESLPSRSVAPAVELLDGGRPVLDINVGGMAIELLIDTGAGQSTIGIADGIFDQLGVTRSVRGSGTVHRGVFGEALGELRAFAWPEPGNAPSLRLEGVDAIAGSGFDHVGNALLRHSIMRLDFVHQVAWFWPNDTAPVTGHVGFGFSWDYDAAGAWVSVLWEGSPAAVAGLELGDRILAVEDMVLERLSADRMCQLRRDWNHHDVDSIQLDVAAKQGRASRRIEISKASMLLGPQHSPE